MLDIVLITPLKDCPKEQRMLLHEQVLRSVDWSVWGSTAFLSTARLDPQNAKGPCKGTRSRGAFPVTADNSAVNSAAAAADTKAVFVGL